MVGVEPTPPDFDQVLYPCSRYRHSPKVERVIGFEPMVNGFAGRRLVSSWLYPLLDWYTRKDSNLHSPVSKTGAFAVLATRAEKLVRAAGFEPANTCFQNKPV